MSIEPVNRVIGESPGRPPLVMFREDFVEDRSGENKGHINLRAINTVIIRQVGSKDTVEKVAEEWLESLARNRDMRPEWINSYKGAFLDWQRDRSADSVVIGTHIKLWPGIDKRMAEVVLNAQCRTIEDLAMANEDTLAKIGIGARELQRRAKAWVDTAKNVGVVAEEVVALRQRDADKDERIKALEEKLMLMAAGVQVGQTKRTVTPDEDFT